MKRVTEGLRKLVCRTVVVDGARLEIVAIEMTETEWHLYKENEPGVRTNWIETFPTAEAALTHGAAAIEAEGIAPFVEIEGFEYLLNGR